MDRLRFHDSQKGTFLFLYRIIFNAMRRANVGVKIGDDISVFTPGKGVFFEQAGNEHFDVMSQINQFEEGFYV